MHIQQLSKGTHETAALKQAVITNSDMSRFLFFLLHHGPEWADVNKRKACENASIKANSHRCFNYIEDIDATTYEQQSASINVPIKMV
jgi:hypothetical protein